MRSMTATVPTADGLSTSETCRLTTSGRCERGTMRMQEAMISRTSCRMCNHYKRANSLETFRRYIAEIPRKLRENYIYKVGVVYGNVIENEKPIKFYFEEMEGK